jgi:D-threo-aldose 1-dehydrogenase
MSAPVLPRRMIGRTGLEVTTLGLGCATLGGSRFPVDRDEGEAILREAWEQGVRFVDTAPLYGYGAAERRVGDALRGQQRSDWVLSTKVGRVLKPSAAPPAGVAGAPRPMPFEAIYDYSYDGVMRSVEDSLQRLGMDRIDMLLVHDIGAYVHGEQDHPALLKKLESGGYRALDQLRSTGIVRAIGLGVFESRVCLEALAFGDWDLFLLAGCYTLLDQAPLDELLPRCLERGISMVVGSPLNSGILAGGTLWNYKPPPAAVAQKVKAIHEVCRDFGVSPVAAALQFPLAHPAVAAVVPGPRSVAEQRENLRLFQQPLPDGLWSALRHAGVLDARAPTPSGATPAPAVSPSPQEVL